MKPNWNLILKEKSEKEQLKELKERNKTTDREKYGRDGYIETWRETFEHKEIKFQLAILRYFNLDDGFKPIGSGDRICSRHVVVEFPKETNELVNLVQELLTDSEFLYHDTLHTFNDKMNLEEQLDCAYDMAISDIDDLQKNIQINIKKHKEIIVKLENLQKVK